MSIPHCFVNKECFVLGCFIQGYFNHQYSKLENVKGRKNYTRAILTEIYNLLGMKSFRDDLIDRMKTGWGCFVLASSL